MVKHEQKTFACPSKNSARKDKKKKENKKGYCKAFCEKRKLNNIGILLSDQTATASWFSPTVTTEEPCSLFFRLRSSFTNPFFRGFC